MWETISNGWFSGFLCTKQQLLFLVACFAVLGHDFLNTFCLIAWIGPKFTTTNRFYFFNEKLISTVILFSKKKKEKKVINQNCKRRFSISFLRLFRTQFTSNVQLTYESSFKPSQFGNKMDKNWCSKPNLMREWWECIYWLIQSCNLSWKMRFNHFFLDTIITFNGNHQ